MFEFESLQRALGELSQEVTTVKVLAALLVLACLTFHDRMLITHHGLRIIYSVYLHPLAPIPGPRLMAVSVLPMGRLRTSGRSPYALAELHNRYGPVVRIGPNEVSCIGSAAFREAYGHRSGKGGPLPRDQRAVVSRRAFGAISLLQADVPTHARMRRRMNPAFSEKAARAQEPLVASYANALIQRLRETAMEPSPGKEETVRTGQAVNLCQYLAWATFDIQGDLVFGEDVFESLRNRRDHPLPTTVMGFFRALIWIKSLTEIFPMWAFAGLQKLMAALPKRGGKSKGIAETMKEHAVTVRRMVDRRMATGATDHPDYMSFIERENATTGEMLTREEMYANAQVLVTAGSETVATVLSGTLYLLLTHGATLTRLQKEVRSTFASESDVDFAGVARLEYLGAVINEAMRVWHPVATPFVRQVPQGGGEVGGYYVPEGALLGISNYATCRSERYFRDAGKFVPERWLGAPEYADDDRDAFQPFGFGPMSCIGSALGRLETRLLLAKLIWNFDMELMPESRNWIENMEHYMVWQKPPLMVTLRQAQAESDGC